MQAPRLLDQLRERLRYLYYSLRTEQTYLYWTRCFIRYHGLRHPRELGKPEVEAFLTTLAHERKVSASTHRQSDTLYKDAMIAATAYARGLTVVTRNLADFERFAVELLAPPSQTGA